MRFGVVDMRSGRWNWYELNLRSVPDWKVAYRKLSLVDSDQRENEMTRDLPLDYAYEAADVEKLARFPDERRVIDEEGVIWILQPLRNLPVNGPDELDEDDPAREVRYFSRQKGGGFFVLTGEIFLGDATNEELLDWIEEAQT